jgi:hypothetical protein
MTSLEVERTAVRIAHRGFIQNQIFEVFGRVRRAWLLRNQPISFFVFFWKFVRFYVVYQFVFVGLGF